MVIIPLQPQCKKGGCLFIGRSLYMLLSIDKFSVYIQKVSSLQSFLLCRIPTWHPQKVFRSFSLRKRFLNQFGVCSTTPLGIDHDALPNLASCLYLQIFIGTQCMRSLVKNRSWNSIIDFIFYRKVMYLSLLIYMHIVILSLLHCPKRRPKTLLFF